MEELKSILEQFDSNREKSIYCVDWEQKSVEEKYNAVAEWFRPCAKEILCGGYFLINNEKIIDIGSIELYYHEEIGDIKDYIMYHTNSKGSHSIYYKEKWKYPYFKFGSFNFHPSGIDVTFENEEKKYRASFLIRSYRVLNKIDDLNIDFDAHSTHIYDDMFYDGVSLNTNNRTTIEWKKWNKGYEIEEKPFTRKNVAVIQKIGEYKDGRPKLQKEKVEITDEDYQKNEEKYIKIDKSHYYKQDMRLWRFKRKNINEIWK